MGTHSYGYLISTTHDMTTGTVALVDGIYKCTKCRGDSSRYQSIDRWVDGSMRTDGVVVCNSDGPLLAAEEIEGQVARHCCRHYMQRQQNTIKLLST